VAGDGRAASTGLVGAHPVQREHRLGDGAEWGALLRGWLGLLLNPIFPTIA
jgi:hypothetical protein